MVVIFDIDADYPASLWAEETARLYDVEYFRSATHLERSDYWFDVDGDVENWFDRMIEEQIFSDIACINDEQTSDTPQQTTEEPIATENKNGDTPESPNSVLTRVPKDVSNDMQAKAIEHFMNIFVKYNNTKLITWHEPRNTGDQTIATDEALNQDTASPVEAAPWETFWAGIFAQAFPFPDFHDDNDHHYRDKHQEDVDDDDDASSYKSCESSDEPWENYWANILANEVSPTNPSEGDTPPPTYREPWEDYWADILANEEDL